MSPFGDTSPDEAHAAPDPCRGPAQRPAMTFRPATLFSALPYFVAFVAAPCAVLAGKLTGQAGIFMQLGPRGLAPWLGLSGLALLVQSWRLALDRWPRSGRAVLAIHPVREVLSVTVFGSEGEASLLAPSGYEADTLSRPARIHFSEMPAPARVMNGIEIDFAAGFGEAGTDVPDLLRRAILLLVAHWYEFRTGFGPGDQPVSYPAGYDRLISGYRARRL